jgi:hypothetical protein
MDDLRGKDKIWQFLELSGIAWLVLFPIVIVADMLGNEVHEHTWSALEAIYFMNLTAKVGHRFMDGKFGDSKKTEAITIESKGEVESATKETTNEKLP